MRLEVPNGFGRQLDWPRTPFSTSDLVLALALGALVAGLPIWASVAILVAVALILAALARPVVGLSLALIVGPLGALEEFVLGNRLLDSGQLFFLLFVGSWLLLGILRRRVYMPHTALNGPLALFIGLAALSTVVAVSLSQAITELVKWLELALMMLIVVDLGSSSRDGPSHLSVDTSAGLRPVNCAWSKPMIRWLLLALLLAGLSQAVIGIWQFGLRGDGPQHFAIAGRFYRAFGTFQQPNPFGGFMSIGASLALGSFAGLAYNVAAVRKGKKIEWQTLRWLAFTGVSGAVMFLAVVASWSRGAWLGFLGAATVGALLLPRRRWLGLGLVILGAIILFAGLRYELVPGAIANRITAFGQDLRLGDVRGVDINNENFSILERLAHWQAAIDMAREHLVMGVGFGNYEASYAQYALINWPLPLGHAHNYYLNILAETGILGAFAYVLFWVAVFAQAALLARRLEWPGRGIAIGLVAAWTTIAVQHLVDNLYVNNLYVYMGAMLGLQQLLARSHD